MLTLVHARWLAATALSYSLCHHLGLLPDGLGKAPEGTRWADWLDLALPWLVLVPAAMTLRAAGADARTWVLLAVGAVLYAEGHGIHLAANSVGNAQPGPTAHLWDELVGHVLWYAGVAVVVAALTRTLTGRPRPHPVGYVLAVAAGTTWGTNAVGGEATAVPALVLAVAAGVTGWRRRAEQGVVLLVAAVPATAVLLTHLVHSG